MAYCENCGSGGHQVSDMVVAVRQLDGENIFIADCCLKLQFPRHERPETEYGVELSSHMGLHAYVKHGGLTFEYKRAPEQLKNVFGPVVNGR